MIDWFLLLISVGVVLLVPTAYAGWIGAPWAPTKLAAIRRVFDKLQVNETDTMIDLGAGNGKIMLEAQRRGAAVIGYELSPIMWFVCWLRMVGKKRSHVYFRDFYRIQLPPATILFIFLMPNNMERVRTMLKAQKLPPETKVLSYAFAMPNATPIDMVREPLCPPLYTYTLGELVK